MSTPAQQVPTTPAVGIPATQHSRRHALIGGLLPFIGVILFIIVTAVQIAGGLETGWQKVMVGNAVAYLIGWAMLGAGIAHLFFGKRISRTIGFQADRYEFEVGSADFAMGLVALLAASYVPEFSWAIILASSIYRVLCGVGHIRSMIQDRNFAPNNTSILFLNFVVPAFLVYAYLTWM